MVCTSEATRLKEFRLDCQKSAQARNQDFLWEGANEAKLDQAIAMYFLLSYPFI